MEPSDPFEPRLLHTMTGGACGRAQGPATLRVIDRRVTKRSRLYFLSAGGAVPELVAKVPLTDAKSDHPPLDALAQFEALRRSHDWFREDDRHAVAEPIDCFPDLGAFVMRYAAGPTVARVFVNAVRDPAAALGAARAAGDFVRRFHAHGMADSTEIDLNDMVDELLRDALEVLSPLQRSLPPEVREMLRQVPRRTVRVRRVVRHGDYVGANLIVTGRTGVTMIDPALSEVGLPEDDVARFLAHLSSTTVFMSGGVWMPVAQLRRRLEEEFLLSYGALPNPHPVFELRLLRQHILRWARRTQHSKTAVDGFLLHGQRLVIDTHMRGLLQEGLSRLRRRVRAEESERA